MRSAHNFYLNHTSLRDARRATAFVTSARMHAVLLTLDISLSPRARDDKRRLVRRPESSA